LKITKEETPSQEVVLNIEVEEEELGPYLAQAASRLGQRVRIPGFRQGKAPRAMVENVVGHEIIREEALDLLIGPMVQKALEEEGVEPFALPQVEVESQDPVVLKATTPVEPSVDLGDYKGIHIETEEVQIDEEKVDEVIERLRYDTAPWEPVERAAEFGDLLTIDVDGWIEDRRISEEKGVDYVLREENRLPLQGFPAHLEGLSKDEEREFTIDVPEDYPDKSMVGKECRFNVKALEVKAKSLPELDDEFAKGLGEEYESLEALKDKVRQDLHQAADREEERRVEEAALSQLLEQATVQYSPLLLDREVDRQMERREQSLKQNRMNMDSYLSQVGKSEEEIREELREETKRELARSLVMDKLATEEDIQVSSEEIDEEIDAMVSRSGGDADSMRNIFSSPDGQRTLENMVRGKKIIGRLREIAVEPVEETASDAPEPEKSDDKEKEPEAEGGKPDGNEA
jgi:trigger factor